MERLLIPDCFRPKDKASGQCSAGALGVKEEELMPKLREVKINDKSGGERAQ